MKNPAETADQPSLAVVPSAHDKAASVPPEPAIDRDHLARMTLGDRRLEREVLELFICQAEMLLGRMENQPPSVVASFSHTLLGSARGVGAWKVAAAAQALERVETSSGASLHLRIQRLAQAVAEAKAAIMDRSGVSAREPL